MRLNYEILIISITLLFFGFHSLSQSKRHELDMFDAVHLILKQHHIDYDTLLDSIPKRLPNLFLSQTDPNSQYLTKLDAKKIEAVWSNFDPNDPQIKRRLNESILLYDKQLTAVLGFLNQWKKLDFFQEDSIGFKMHIDTLTFAKDQKSLNEWWVRKIKLRVLDSYKKDSLLNDLSPLEINQFLNEKANSIVTSEKCNVQSLTNDDKIKVYLLNAALNAFCMSFDPHSRYLSPSSEERMLSGLSSEVYDTGISFVQSGTRYFISDISTFSDAANYPGIRIGDEITGLFKDETLQSISCLTANEINELFYGRANSNLTLELKSNLDNSYHNYTLSKSMNTQSMNHTFSYLLGENDMKIGYIQFPGFYSSFNIASRSSAQDLALILMNMKSKSVDDVIIDLRNNGGGSIFEAEEILKYFINYGPLYSYLSQVQPHVPQLQKDTKKGKLVNGKTIFLVNGFSASASELVAATMQKYPQSLVVGSTTYGKSTGQVMIPLDRNGSESNRGLVLVTNLKLFRFDGNSYQKNGVSPDISLPTIYNRSLASEALLKYPLDCPKVRSFRAITNREAPITDLRLLSDERNNLENLKSLVQEFNDQIEQENYISLRFDQFKSAEIEQSVDHPITFESNSISNLEENEAFLLKSLELKKNLEKDPILFEVFNIFKDWKQITENQ